MTPGADFEAADMIRTCPCGYHGKIRVFTASATPGGTIDRIAWQCPTCGYADEWVSHDNATMAAEKYRTAIGMDGLDKGNEHAAFVIGNLARAYLALRAASGAVEVEREAIIAIVRSYLSTSTPVNRRINEIESRIRARSTRPETKE